MKRICALVLCLCIVLSGCQSKEQDQTNEAITDNTEENSSENNETEIGDDQADISTAPEVSDSGVLQLDKDWTSVATAKMIKAEYVKPVYEAKAASFQIAKDLSNVENIGQFSGFSKEQIKMLVNNGFVVLPTKSTKSYYTYDGNEYSGVPNFITSDSVLHLYHQFYDKSLINVESTYLYNDLDLMTKQMLDKSLQLLAQLEDEELKALQKNNVVYFLVARMLMLQTTELSVEVEDELLAIAKQEYALASKAEGIQLSPLIQKDVDYSQFTVRGHYTRTEELGRFFRTMMWFGTFPYAFYNETEVYQYNNVLQSLLISYMTFAESEEICDAELWSNIYLPTSQYVGLSDDIDVFTMNNLRKEVFGENEDPNIFNDKEYFDQLLKEVQELPEPQIQGKTVTTSMQTGKQFRFMGQRYILDSDVLQDLVEPILRPIPSGLDVMGVLGSNIAEQLQFEVYQPQEDWPEYTKNYTEWKDSVSTLTSEYWSTNLYTGWLWTLQEALKEYDVNSGMPFFMTTAAWKNKMLNTTLGSYTELKHDTVLYGKQAMAEMGGPVEFADSHYVEPEVELYNKLYYLTDYTISILEERGMLNADLLEGATKYKELLRLLITCSIKELQNQPLSEEENDQLLRYGGSLENISNSFLNGIIDEDYPNIEISDMLVSDVSSSNGAYLSLGTGYFDDIYVVAPLNGKLYLCRGSVYSYYEFTSSQRLTDEQWWELQGITVVHSEYADYTDIGDPSENLPVQPEWTKTFKKGENKVAVQALEIDWENLNE